MFNCVVCVNLTTNSHYFEDSNVLGYWTVSRVNLLKPNDIYIYIIYIIYMSYRSANLQTLHFIYLFNKYTY